MISLAIFYRKTGLLEELSCKATSCICPNFCPLISTALSFQAPQPRFPPLHSPLLPQLPQKTQRWPRPISLRHLPLGPPSHRAIEVGKAVSIGFTHATCCVACQTPPIKYGTVSLSGLKASNPTPQSVPVRIATGEISILSKKNGFFVFSLKNACF